MEELLDSPVRNEISACNILQEIVDFVTQCINISSEERPHEGGRREAGEAEVIPYQQHPLDSG